MTKHELIGKEIMDLWYDKKQALNIRKSYVDTLKPVIDKKIPFKHKSGEKRLLNISIIPIFNKHGEHKGSYNFSEDVTEKVKNEKELLLYKKIIDSTSEGVIITDNNNKIVYAT